MILRFPTYVFGIVIILMLSCGGGKKDISNQTEYNDTTPSAYNLLTKGDAARVEKFIADLQEYVKNKDKQAIAKLIKFPIYGVKTEQDFLDRYNKIFTDKVKKGVLENGMKSIFSNYKGVRIAGDLIWISQFKNDKNFFIYSIKFEEPEPNLKDPDCVFGKWINTKDRSDTLILEKGHWRRTFSDTIPRAAIENSCSGNLRVLDEKIAGFNALNETIVKCKGRYLMMSIGEGEVEPVPENICEYSLKNGILNLCDKSSFKRIK